MRGGRCRKEDAEVEAGAQERRSVQVQAWLRLAVSRGHSE
jgi:hypothetical protein